MTRVRREGQIIDYALVKNVLDIHVDLYSDSWSKLYNKDFEDTFLKSTIDYYCKKAEAWILNDSFPGYMVKVIEVLLKNYVL